MLQSHVSCSSHLAKIANSIGLVSLGPFNAGGILKPLDIFKRIRPVIQRKPGFAAYPAARNDQKIGIGSFELQKKVFTVKLRNWYIL